MGASTDEGAAAGLESVVLPFRMPGIAVLRDRVIGFCKSMYA